MDIVRGPRQHSPVTRPRAACAAPRAPGTGPQPDVEDRLTLMDASTLQLIIPIAGIIAVLFAIYLARECLPATPGRPRCRRWPARSSRARSPSSGASTRRSRSSRSSPPSIIGVVISLVETEGSRRRPEARRASPIGVMTAFAFLVGAACSMASGIIGMFVAVRANVRTASAARRSLVEAVQVAMRGGAVSGFLVVALSLLGVWGIFTLYDDVLRRAPSPKRRSSSSGSGSAPRSSRSSPSSAVASTPRPPTSGPTSSARSRRASPRTIPATRASSPTSSATTSATAPAVAPTSSSRPPPRTSAR